MLRDRQKEETRRRLFEAALEVFRSVGIGACKIEDIAQKAEVSRAAFYFHFPTKEDVLVEFLKGSESPVVEAIRSAPMDLPIADLLDRVAVSMAQFWEPHKVLVPDVVSMALKRFSEAPLQDVFQTRSILRERFVAAQKQVSPLVPVEVLADIYLVNSLAAMLSWSGQSALSLEMMLKGVAMIFLNGVGSKQAL